MYGVGSLRLFRAAEGALQTSHGRFAKALVHRKCIESAFSIGAGFDVCLDAVDRIKEV